MSTIANVTFRHEDPVDRSRVTEILRLGFQGDVQATIVEALRRSSSPLLSLVAESEGKVVGHLMFSAVTMDAAPNVAAVQLSPVAVDPAYQRLGIGSALIRAGLTTCASQNWDAVFLVGDPRYYARFGFTMATPLGFTHEGPHGAFLQVLELQTGSLGGLGDRVRFHPAFDDAS